MCMGVKVGVQSPVRWVVVVQALRRAPSGRALCRLCGVCKMCRCGWVSSSYLKGPVPTRCGVLSVCVA